MEVSIRNCPACGTAVMGDSSTCSACGQVMPDSVPAESGPAQTTSKSREVTCAKCGARVPKSVLRCRDCGAYMSVELEAAMLAKQMSRAYGGPGRPVGAPVRVGPASSSFAEVADDADF